MGWHTAPGWNWTQATAVRIAYLVHHLLGESPRAHSVHILTLHISIYSSKTATCHHRVSSSSLVTFQIVIFQLNLSIAQESFSLYCTTSLHINYYIVYTVSHLLMHLPSHQVFGDMKGCQRNCEKCHHLKLNKVALIYMYLLTFSRLISSDPH